MQAALGLLCRRALSAAELRAKLRQRGYEDDETEQACERMRDYGYIDDSALAQSVCRVAAAAGRGGRAVAQKLSQRGLSHSDLGTDTATHDDAAKEAAVTRVASRFALALHDCAAPDGMDPATRGRALRFLQRRGFSFSVSDEVLRLAHAHVHAPADAL